jgi:serine-type D-Ala-D-Ala carboxypeptidase/endopeptidase (penicillin-binding protein 4)
MKTFWIILCLFAATAAFSDSGNRKNSLSTQSEVETLIRQRNYPPPSLGVLVQDVEHGTTVVSLNADSMFNPASVTKLFTAAMAYDRLGPDHLFTTQIFIDTMVELGTTAAVRNCYVRGDGDPGFTAERLWLFVEHLYHCGIRKISGDLILDDFFFDSVSLGPGFDKDSTCRAYQPLISALAMNFSTVAVHCRPGPRIKQPVIVDLFPELYGARVTALAATIPPGRKKNGLEISTALDSGATIITVKGSMGIDEPGSYNFRRLWQTWEAFGNALVPLFARRGILFQGRIIHGKVPYQLGIRAPFYEFFSEPLSAEVGRMFKYSSNFTAEMLFKTLSARLDSVQGSWERSMVLAGSWWKEHSLPGSPIMVNGSGMGDVNRFSPAQIVALLSYVWQQKTWLPDYLAALSTSGLDGTLKSRLAKSKLKGFVRAKTGTLNALGVNTLAGYLLLPGSPPFAFAIFCSRTGHTQYEDWTMQEQILEKTVSPPFK